MRASDGSAHKTVYQKYKVIWFKTQFLRDRHNIIKTKRVFFGRKSEARTVPLSMEGVGGGYILCSTEEICIVLQ